MDAFDHLQATFETYLTALPDMRMRPAMIDALRKAGLHDEANALALYVPGEEPVTTWQSGVWSGKRCFVSAHMPTAGQPGDLWFDVVELATHVFVPHLPHYSKDVSAWLAIHPVWMWQFKAFLKVVKWRKRNSLLINVTDLMDGDRFRNAPGDVLADNVYHDEATAYCQWFGKSIGGDALWHSARSFLDHAQFNDVFRGGFKLWAGSMSFDESLRDAFGVNDLDMSSADRLAEVEALTTQIGQVLAHRTIFDEFERQPQIGFSTDVYERLGLLPEQLPRRSFEFVELRNLARRPR